MEFSIKYTEFSFSRGEECALRSLHESIVEGKIVNLRDRDLFPLEKQLANIAYLTTFADCDEDDRIFDIENLLFLYRYNTMRSRYNANYEEMLVFLRDRMYGLLAQFLPKYFEQARFVSSDPVLIEEPEFDDEYYVTSVSRPSEEAQLASQIRLGNSDFEEVAYDNVGVLVAEVGEDKFYHDRVSYCKFANCKYINFEFRSDRGMRCYDWLYVVFEHMTDRTKYLFSCSSVYNRDWYLNWVVKKSRERNGDSGIVVSVPVFFPTKFSVDALRFFRDNFLLCEKHSRLCCLACYNGRSFAWVPKMNNVKYFLVKEFGLIRSARYDRFDFLEFCDRIISDVGENHTVRRDVFEMVSFYARVNTNLKKFNPSRRCVNIVCFFWLCGYNNQYLSNIGQFVKMIGDFENFHYPNPDCRADIVLKI